LCGVVNRGVEKTWKSYESNNGQEMDSSDQNEDELQLDSAWAEYMRRCDEGEQLDREAFIKQFPEIADQLSGLLAAADALERMAGPDGDLTTLISGIRVSRPVAEEPENPHSSTLPLHFDAPGRPEPQGSMDVTIGVDVTRQPAESMIAPAVGGNVESTSPKLPMRFGEYTLEKLLGRGGMGVVYRAKQDHLDRIVAVKMIRSGALASEEEVQRFYAEARSAAKLDHPNIVMVYQCGELGGHHYFSMDYVPGTDLARIIEQGPVDPRHAARYVRDVAKAIDYAHQRGVIHRDLKPANVLIDSEDHVHVTDFGLAKVTGVDSGLTRSGCAIGTPSYMSPEQALGRSDQHSATTDVYSLGAILFALLVGKPPFQGATVVQTMMQVIHRPAPSLRQLRAGMDEDLNTIVAKCLSKQPGKRYQSAAEMAAELERYLSGRPIEARPQTLLQRFYHWALGIPLLGALAGYKVLDPTPGQRLAQRWMIAASLLLPLLLVLGFVATQWAGQQLPREIRIAGGEANGVYHSISQQLAAKLAGHARRDASVQATEGSLENSRLLITKDCDLALLQASSVVSEEISVVAPLYYEAVHLLVPARLTSSSLEELLKSKARLRVWLGLPQSGNRQAAEMLLATYGLDEAKFETVPGGWESLGEVEKVDLVFVVIRAGHQRVRDLIEQKGYRLVSLEKATDIALDEPTFRSFDIPSETYQLPAAAPIRTLATTAFLACRTDAPDRLVKEALYALYESDNSIPELMNKEKARHWRGLAYHRAAKEYFDDLEK
jgi:eukaryotic-like serine/threonine-protein kinase